MRTAKEWNALPVSVFPDHYDLNVFKTRVNRLFLTSKLHPQPHRHLTSDEIVVKRQSNLILLTNIINANVCE